MPQVLWKGNPTETTGPELKAGDKAPDAFSVAGNDLAAVKGADWAGKTRIVLSAPSIDTGVCDTEGRRFNDEAAKLPGVLVHYVTMDLPFAQKRWCGAHGIERVRTYSDWRERSFGPAYGVLAPAKQLLIRAVFVIDKNDVIKHVEYVKEVGTEPNYAAALEAAKAAG